MREPREEEIGLGASSPASSPTSSSSSRHRCPSPPPGLLLDFFIRRLGRLIVQQQQQQLPADPGGCRRLRHIVPAARHDLLASAPRTASPAAPAATAAAAIAAGASNKRKCDNKASTFGFNCTVLLGPAGESGGLALGNGPLGRPSSGPEEPAYTSTPWKKTNYSPGVVGLTLHNCWVSGEAIDELHERYLEMLTQLFEEHKAKYGLPQDKHLTIT
ncbi:non-canonical polyA RNA polymerase PAPD5 [Crotalus adamanteus]|uniref:Non-canonical polyA RNA polymerase PAPD5 n=1 Tax=Crotalus adamanteus TaxID=8729 RepID=A0AAW1BC24_CROAD